MQRLVVVDDDRDIRTLLAEHLTDAGFQVSTARDGLEMRRVLERVAADLIILDLNLPGEDGLALCREIRRQATTPVIMLTARKDLVDRIVGLELGADDYVAKPFDLRELVARVRSVLRRSTGSALPNAAAGRRKARFSGWTLDLQQRHLVDPKGRVVVLSGAEFRLLGVFVMYPNQVLSRERLVALARGREYDTQQRVVDVHISHLRRKLGDDSAASPLIKTVRSEGYVLASEVLIE